MLSLTTASADRVDRVPSGRRPAGDGSAGGPGRTGGADVLVTGDPVREENGSR